MVVTCWGCCLTCFGVARCILLQATVPAVTFRRLQHALSTRRFALQVASFQGPGRPGHPHLGPFLAVQHTRARIFAAPRAQACICPCLGVLAAAYRLHVRLPYGGSTSSLRLSFCGSTLSSRSSPRGVISALRLGSPPPSPIDGILILCSPFCEDALTMRSLFHAGPSGLRSPFCGSSCTCLPSCSNLSTSCLATPFARDTHASNLAAVALSASRAGSRKRQVQGPQLATLPYFVRCDVGVRLPPRPQPRPCQ